MKNNIDKNGFPILGDRFYFGDKDGKKPYKHIEKEESSLQRNPKIKELEEVEIVKGVNTLRKNFQKIKKEDSDLIFTITAGKYEDLFKPLNKSNILEALQNLLEEVNGEKLLIRGKTLTLLKILGYLKLSKNANRKYILNSSDEQLVIGAALIMDLADKRNDVIFDFLRYLENLLISKQKKNHILIEFIDQISDLLSQEFELLHCIDITSLNHYDPKIKFIRVLKEPKLNNLLSKCIESLDIDGTNDFAKLNLNDFEKGIFCIKYIKKIGLNFINSRSNLEWLIYEKSLKKIRNFLSRDKHFAFLKAIDERIELYKQSNDSLSNDFILLENTVKKLIVQRMKKQS